MLNMLASKSLDDFIDLGERNTRYNFQMTAGGAAGARDVQRVRKARICALQQACYKVKRGLEA